MRRSGWGITASLSFLLASTAHALPLTGWSSALYPAIGSHVGADWSSDFGLDYSATPFGAITGNGFVTNGSWVAPGEDYVAPNSTYVASVSRSLLGGDVSGQIAVDIGSYGAIGTDVVHHYRMSFDDSNPAGCCGISTGGVIEGRFDFDKGTLNANTPVPQYWVAEYTVDVVNPGTNYYLNFGAYFGQTLLLPSTTPASGRYTGSFSGSGTLPWLDNFCFGSLDQCSRSYWQFIASGFIDGGAILGNASLDIDIALAFSDTPFDHIVYHDVTPTPTTGVAEPGILSLFGAGFAFVVLSMPWARRSRYKRRRLG